MSGTIVIWGAGRIGRGFIADLFHAAGWRLILVDQSQELVEHLSREGRYTVVRAEGADRQEEVEIAGYAVLTTTQAGDISAAITDADLLAVAVFPSDFADVTRQLASALLARREERPDVPLDVLLCTNLSHPAPEFRRLLQDALPADAQLYGQTKVGIVETLVIRIAPDPPADLRARDPLLVWTNGYPELPVDRRHELGRAFDLRDPAEREAFEAAGAHEAKCTGVVARAAQWGVEIIGEEQIGDTLRRQASTSCSLRVMEEEGEKG